MTDREINQVIFEAHEGKTVVEFRAGSPCAENEAFESPRYTRDRDVVCEAEKRVLKDERWKLNFQIFLARELGLEISNIDPMDDEVLMSFLWATAHQRASALAKTIRFEKEET